MTVKFNGVTKPDFIRVVGLSFSTISNISVNESVIPNRVGNYDSGIQRGGAVCNLNIQLHDTDKSIFQLKRELKAWLKGDNWKTSKLELEENPGKFLWARVGADSEINDLFTHGETDIQFYCADPKEYDTELTEASFTGSEFVVLYQGIEETATIFEVTLKADYPNLSIRHKETGNTISLTGAFKANQKLLLDSDRKLVKLNDILDMNLVNFSSNWLYLDSEMNSFKLFSTQAGNEVAVTADTKITYRKAD